jgi:hypothetical protein
MRMHQIPTWRPDVYQPSAKLEKLRQERMRKAKETEEAATSHAIQPIPPKDDDEEDDEPPHERTDILV